MTTRREFLMLADTFNADKHNPVGMVASEKLDGNRCWWDGGVSRGVPTTSVPWASVLNPKTGQPKDKIKPTATGLWSRYGNPVQAPEWFLDRLPSFVPLDGELYAGRGEFQTVQKLVRRDDADDDAWLESGIKFAAFGAPTYAQVFTDGLIKNPNFLAEINRDQCLRFVSERGQMSFQDLSRRRHDVFLSEITIMKFVLCAGSTVSAYAVEQCVIKDEAQLYRMLKTVTDGGGEGIMLRDPGSAWYPKRRPFLLKVKPRHDAEATISGFVAGKKGKTGQFLGKLGALIVEWKGKTFEIGTGLTHADRVLHVQDAAAAAGSPGKPLTGLVGCTPVFTIGDQVTFSYMGLTKDGIPREPAYMRIREDV